MTQLQNDKQNKYQAEALKHLKENDIYVPNADYQYITTLDNQYQIEALKYLVKNNKYSLDYQDIAKFDNQYQVEALKYTSLDRAQYFKNEYQVEALKHLQENLIFVSNEDYQYITTINNHCQSDAIKEGNPVYSVFNMKCTGIVDPIDHADF